MLFDEKATHWNSIDMAVSMKLPDPRPGSKSEQPHAVVDYRCG
jgi:hypothetical protein